MKKIIIAFVLLSQVTFAQVKSQFSSIQFNGKSATAFSIELPQNLDYVKQLFANKFELDRLGTPKKVYDKYTVYYQIKEPKITSSFIDLYYLIEEFKSENGSTIKITMLISKGYDNFISKETDLEATVNILDALNDLGVSVERKNFEVQIAKKEQEVQVEKQKLLLVEDELAALENEKKELDNQINKTRLILVSQAKTTQDLGDEIQKIKNVLSDFEKNTSHKSRATLKSVSKK